MASLGETFVTKSYVKGKKMRGGINGVGGNRMNSGGSAAGRAVSGGGRSQVRRTKTVTAWSGNEVSRTKSVQKGTARAKKEQAIVGKRLQKKGSTDSGLPLTSPRVTAKGYKGMGPVASKQTKVPIKKIGKR